MKTGRFTGREEDWLWLCSIPGIYRNEKSALLHYFGSPGEIRTAPPAAFEPWRKLGVKWVTQLIRRKEEESCGFEKWKELRKKGISFVSCESSLYPEKLLQTADYPYGIFYKGSLPSQKCISVAIVGSRCCSGYGRAVAEELAAALASRGDIVISGMALGIDGYAQAAALAAGGISCGVLGCGVDQCYPKEHLDLCLRLQKQGGILSEFAPETRPLRSHFPIRNRIISGLSDIVVVVEAREKSGSLITADFAIEQGRDVYAVPGRCCDPLSRGCNQLIESGAQVYLSVRDFLEMTAGDSSRSPQYGLNGTTGGDRDRSGTDRDNGPADDTRTDDQNTVLQALDLTPKDAGTLCKETGLTVQKLCSLLLRLQLAGEVREVSRQMYVRTKLPGQC